jgi:hypothetical protein
VELWVREVGGAIDRGSAVHELVMSLYGGMNEGERKPNQDLRSRRDTSVSEGRERRPLHERCSRACGASRD